MITPEKKAYYLKKVEEVLAKADQATDDLELAVEKLAVELAAVTKNSAVVEDAYRRACKEIETLKFRLAAAVVDAKMYKAQRDKIMDEVLQDGNR